MIPLVPVSVSDTSVRGRCSGSRVSPVGRTPCCLSTRRRRARAGRGRPAIPEPSSSVWSVCHGGDAKCYQNLSRDSPRHRRHFRGTNSLHYVRIFCRSVAASVTGCGSSAANHDIRSGEWSALVMLVGFGHVATKKKTWNWHLIFLFQKFCHSLVILSRFFVHFIVISSKIELSGHVQNNSEQQLTKCIAEPSACSLKQKRK